MNNENNENLNNNLPLEPINQLNIVSEQLPNEANNQMMTMVQPEPPIAIAPNKKVNPTLIVALAIVVLAVGIGFYFFSKNNSKQMIIAKSFDRLQSAFVDNVKFDFALPKIEEFLQSGKISLKANSSEPSVQELLDEYTKYNAAYNLERRNDALYFDLDLKEKEKSLLDLKMLGKDDKIYLLAEKVFKKTIEFDYNTDLLVKDEYVTVDDYLYLYDLIFEKIVRNMDDSYFAKEKATIKIDGKDVDVTKTTLLLNQEKLFNLSNKVLADLKKDKRGNEILNKLFEDFSKFEFQKEDFPNDIKMNYVVYTSGLLNDVVGVDIEYYIMENNKMVVGYRAEKEDTFYLGDGTETVRITVKNERNDLTVTIFDTTNTQVAQLTVKCADAKALEAKLVIDIAEINVNFSYNVKIEEVTSNKEYNITNTSKTSLSMSGSEMLSLEVNVDMNLKDVSDTEFNRNVNTTNTVKYDAITSQEYNEITNNISKIFEEPAAYTTLNTASEFKTVANSSNVSMIVLGKESCGWCSYYKEEINKVAKNYAVNIYYVDSDNINLNEYNQILNSGVNIPATCSNTGSEVPLSSGYGTPLTIFTKDGKAIDCISEYVSSDTVISKLKALGMIS